MITCGAYIHIPFCASKCGYCDFISYAGLDHLYKPYLQAMVDEIESRAREYPQLETVYFGGGTPSLCSSTSLATVLKALRRSFDIMPGAEVSIEVNPESLNTGKCLELLEAGFNRISIGVQSFDIGVLNRLGRQADRKRNIAGFHQAREAGFKNINIDLMYGLAGQKMNDWERALDTALVLDPEHISAYCLTVPKSSPVPAAPEEIQAEMMQAAHDRLTGTFEHYEISNYAKPGQRCRHNLIYWRNENYLGFGAGAHSHLNQKRAWNIAHPAKYITLMASTGSVRAGDEETSMKDEMADTIYMAFRLQDGLDLDNFADRFQIRFEDVYAPQIARAVDGGMLLMRDRRVVLSDRGRMFADAVAVEFV